MAVGDGVGNRKEETRVVAVAAAWDGRASGPTPMGDNSAVLKVVASRVPGAAANIHAMQKGRSLLPIEVNGRSYLEIKELGLNASTFTQVHLVATERDNSTPDRFAHGQRHLKVCKRIATVDNSIRVAAKRELEILERLSKDDNAGRRMMKLEDKEEAGKQLTLLMEYGGGGTLEDWQPDDAPEFIATCATMLRCLDWLHGLSVVHLDIKPANFVFSRGRLKLIDFGVARELNGYDDVLSFQTPFPGSMDYLAPEAIMGGDDDGTGPYKVSAFTDIWAFGCTVSKIGTGHTPFPPSESRDLEKQRMALRNAQAHLGEAFGRAGLVPIQGVGDITQQLVALCVKIQPTERPRAYDLLAGPLFQPPSSIKPVALKQVSVVLSPRINASLRRGVSFTPMIIDKVDLLFQFYAFTGHPKDIFVARRVCKYLMTTGIDGAHRQATLTNSILVQ